MIATTRNYVKSNRDRVFEISQGLLGRHCVREAAEKGNHRYRQKKLRLSAEQTRHLERSLDLLNAKYYEAMPYPSLRGVETVLGFVEKDNPNAKGADPKSFIDDTLLGEIDASGFVKGLYQR